MFFIRLDADPLKCYFMAEGKMMHMMDETGLTGKQKITLLSMWGLLKQDLHVHGRNVLLTMFNQHPEFLSYFDFSADLNSTNLADNEALFSHSLNMINGFGALIEYGLNSPKMFQCSLTKLAKNHKWRMVSGVDVRLFGNVMLNYFIEVLDRQAANDLPNAFGRFMDIIADAFDDYPSPRASS
ncbi:myoglobin-like [Topomyia yanbarensis]|uniref:myoglobin-like n=1 Tax=Topomyia yanbarensis TaxID=2498891 RepID=UPI00273B3C7D|nr:myoglobin-like [Topomyia yanbarensis]